MTQIIHDVGRSGTNNSSDVVLVQAMLQAIRSKSGDSYLLRPDEGVGVCGEQTVAAIRAFQLAKCEKLPEESLGQSVGFGGRDHIGLIRPGGTTIQKLVASLPGDFREMMVFPKTTVVYLPGSQKRTQIITSHNIQRMRSHCLRETFRLRWRMSLA